MALFPGGCEFPLLRERFWKLAAAGMPATPDQQRGRSPSPSKARLQPEQAASAPSPLPELRQFDAPTRPLRSAVSLSVDLGSLRGRGSGDGAYLAPAFGRQLMRMESDAQPGRGRFGLRSLDLQAGHPSHARPASCTELCLNSNPAQATCTSDPQHTNA